MVHFLKKYFISWGAIAPMPPPGYATGRQSLTLRPLTSRPVSIFKPLMFGFFYDQWVPD